MGEINNGYSMCLNEWVLDKEIKNELGLLLMISSLCAEKGYCYASNKYFAELFDIDEASVSRKLKLLESKKYITIEYEKRGCEITKRYLRLTKMSIVDKQKCQSSIDKNINRTIDKNVKENNISIKIKEKYNKKKNYGEFKNVLLTDEEYAKLEKSNLLSYIEILSSYIASKGKKYKSHYATILTWARKDKPKGKDEYAEYIRI